MADVALRPTLARNAPEQVAAGTPLDQSDAIASLLSLSLAEGAVPAKPLDVKTEPPAHQSIPAANAPSTSVPLSTSLSSGGKHHRRLSSTGKTRRRLSDAREAANRPSPSLLQSSSAALSLATLSLSSSPPSSYPGQVSASFTGASRTLAPAPPKGANGATSNDSSGIPVTGEDEKNGAIPIPISSSNGRTGKKRGMDHRCESCSKIYRHPSCLIKHRWEHTPHWREASKFVLSKHQQVQLLEAAAILSHMSPAASGGRSLPEDRSLWPSFLSGGSLPPPEPPIPTNRNVSGSDSNAPAPNAHKTVAPSPSYMPHPVSSSVPARSTSTGPRLHDYGVGSGVVTQLRPGLVGVTTSSGGVAVIGERSSDNSVNPVSSTQPVPVPGVARHHHDAFGSVSSTGSASYYRNQHGAAPESWGSHGYGSAGQHGLVGYPYSNGVAGSLHNGSSAPGGWSLPKSSVRSGSAFSRSRSHSRTRRTASGSSESPPSDDESIDVDGMMEDARERALDREVNVVIEEEEDEEDGVGMVGVDGGKTGMRTPRVAQKGPTTFGGGKYPQLLGRTGYQSLAGGRTLRSRTRADEDDMARNISLREEDEEMDEIELVRAKGPMTKKEQEWDGMEMEMEMDMD
ncbi:hypothetical protein DFP72DRAFT_1062817 [Ephemerocybe angulata]|uniref:C2H2-type domain-containing protein n=1 Tax=Ephemerocybe angulata TaxID=980116 RepID=A0A8H6MCU1_9AGAR|nr:hypothetical protein DFP72DRAFT_1062817 [Tulosesus angulatus]